MKYLGKDENGDSIWVEDNHKRFRPFEPDVVSDSLGCTKWQVNELREDARRNGFNVEFVDDKGPSAVEGFYPCKGTPAEMARYEKYRMGTTAERNAGAGNVISARELAEAERRVREKYPVKDGK